MATTVGKFLVLLTGAISVLFLTLALALYTNRLNWFTETAAGGEKLMGKVEALKAEIDAAVARRDRATARWNYNYQTVLYYEGERPKRRAFYADQLAIASTGKDAAGKDVPPPHVQELAYAPSGEIDFTRPTGRTPYLLRPNQPLLNVRAGEDLQAQLAKAITQTQGETQALIQQQEKLTREIVGEANVKGLRTQIDEQTAFLRAAEDEQRYLLPFLTNRTAEAISVLRRNDSLKARLKELQSAGLAADAR